MDHNQQISKASTSSRHGETPPIVKPSLVPSTAKPLSTSGLAAGRTDIESTSTTQTDQHQRAGLRLLSLDGGGIRGLSELLILREIMRRIQLEEGRPTAPLPCEYFDLICGTSTGGLIALMLGRLRLPVDKAIDAYGTFAEQVFSEKKPFWKDGRFKASNLENAIKTIIKESTGDPEARMFDPGPSREVCKTFVCAMPANNITAPRLFRTYSVGKYESFDCAIWEAARATSAAPTFFKPIFIGKPPTREPFVDAGLGCNNPIKQILREAEHIFPHQHIACIVSIGTGHVTTARLPASSLLNNIIPLSVAEVLKKITTECETTAEETEQRFRSAPNVYFRFNVEQGMESVTLADWERSPEVTTQTLRYLGWPLVDEQVTAAAIALRERREVIPSAYLNTVGTGTVNRLSGKQRARRRACPLPTRRFTGRHDILSQLEEYFFPKQTFIAKEQQHIFVLYGLGGVGKTQIALSFIDEFYQCFWRVYYVDASSVSTIECGLEDIARDEGIGETAEDALLWLSGQHQGWLLLLDNADDGDIKLQKYFPACKHGNIIVTSRIVKWCAHALRSNCHVSGMEAAEAIDLLLMFSTAKDCTKDHGLATQIAEELGYLALAIVQAGAYISNGCSFNGYLDILQKERAQLMSKHSDMIDDYQLAVYATWEISFKELSLIAQRLLHLCAFLHYSSISKSIFKKAALMDPDEDDIKQFLDKFQTADGSWSDFKFQEVINELTSYSLITTNEGDYTFFLHPLVHAWAGERLEEEEQEHNQGCMMQILALSIPLGKSTADHTFRRTLLSHINERHRKGANADMANKFAQVFHEAGRWMDARELYVKVMETRKMDLGEEHPNTLTAMGSLAATYRSLGQWKDAQGLQIKVVEGSNRVLGEEHPDTLTAITNLATTYRRQGKWKDAQELQIKVVEASKRVLGEEHPDTLTAMGRLASTYRSLGQLKDAQELEMKVMEGSKRVLGEDHPDTLAAMGSLAATYRRLGQWKDAQELQIEVMEASKRVLGEEHPDTLNTMNRLATIHWNLGQWKDAQELEIKVMEGSKRVLGQEHPSTLITIGNLAATYRSRGQWKDAQELEIKVMEARKRVLGEEHPNTLTAITNLAATYWSLGQWKDAQELQIKVMDASKRVLGEEHPDTLTAMGSLATTYQSLGQWKDAQELDIKVMEASKRVLGEEHPDTLTATGNLAATYRSLGQWKDAQELQIKVVEESKRVLGEEHPDTLTAMGSLATTYWSLGQWKDAQELQIKVMEASKTVLDEEHPYTLTAMGGLAATYRSLGQWKDAQELEIKVMEGSKRILGEDHPNTLTAITNLATTYWSLGQWKDAQALQIKVMDASKRVLGEEHPDTLTAMRSLATTYRSLGQWKDAQELDIKVMEASKRVLGEEHPDTLTATGNLAATYRSLGQWKDAQELQIKVVEESKRVLGEEHPDTLTAMGSLATTYQSLGQWKDAQELQIKVMEASKRVLGEDHPKTLMAMGSLAATYRSLGQWKDAQELEVQVIETQARLSPLLVA